MLINKWTGQENTRFDQARKIEQWTTRPSGGDQRLSSTQYLTSTEDIPGPGELLPPVHSQVCCYTDTPELTAAQNSHVLQWTLPATIAFNVIKDAPANATLLVHPKPNPLPYLMTDESDVVIGAVL